MHVQISCYFICCILSSIFFTNEVLTSMLLCVLLFLHQYFYLTMFIHPTHVEPRAHCTECDAPTTASFIHCKTCNLCFPVTYFHWDLVERCVNIDDVKKYTFTVRLILGINTTCSLIQSIVYPPFLVLVLCHIVAWKSIDKYLRWNI